MTHTTPLTLEFLGEPVLFRNNSTGAPTRIHFLSEETKKTFCGFDSFGAEVVNVDEYDYLSEENVCKKCLKRKREALTAIKLQP
jgi:hypothetical protein